MTFDIVIPVRNGAAYLRRTMPGFIATGHRCIVVDDASTDDSAAVAEEAGASVIRLPVHVGCYSARNTGAATSNADVLVFLDADVSLRDDTLPRIRAHFATRP